jgi:acetamidase/formamidase
LRPPLAAGAPWSPPSIKDGHEVNLPVAVDGAKVGDSIAITIKRIEVRSRASSSGVDKPIEGRYTGSPSIMGKCPKCGIQWPEAEIKGVGLEAIKCGNCGASISPYEMVHGYTMLFDEGRRIGITVDRILSEIIARGAGAWAGLPSNSKQVPALISNKSALVGVVARALPFMGQLGTIPSVDIPASRNAGDIKSNIRSLEDLPRFSLTIEEIGNHLTDGHLDRGCGKGGQHTHLSRENRWGRGIRWGYACPAGGW